MVQNTKLPKINKNFSYEQLVISYLEENGKTTIDKLYEYIISQKATGKTGKRYLREVVTNRYKGSDIFNYENPYAWLKQEYLDSLKQDISIFPEELSPKKKYREGSAKTIVVNAYERNVKAKIECLKYYGTRCQICGFKFSEKYGQEFEKKIHVHHIKPISEIGEEYQIDPVKDLIPVCPNCHMVIHSKGNGNVYSIDEVRNMIQINS